MLNITSDSSSHGNESLSYPILCYYMQHFCNKFNCKRNGVLYYFVACLLWLCLHGFIDKPLLILLSHSNVSFAYTETFLRDTSSKQTSVEWEGIVECKSWYIWLFIEVRLIDPNTNQNMLWLIFSVCLQLKKVHSFWIWSILLTKQVYHYIFFLKTLFPRLVQNLVLMEETDDRRHVWMCY